MVNQHQVHGWPSLINAHWERRLACVGRSNTEATAQIAEEGRNVGSDASEYKMNHSLLCIVPHSRRSVGVSMLTPVPHQKR